MPKGKEPLLSPSDRVQVNFSKSYTYDFLITKPSKLGFNAPITITALFQRLKERKYIEHYEGRYPAVIDTAFISSVSVPRKNFKSTELSLEGRDPDLDY